MKKLLILSLILGIFSCEPRQGKAVEEVPENQTGMHEIVVQEVLQANSYTYVKATEKGAEIWLAILKTDIEVGKKYYYEEAMEMKDFKSKDLDRTFESVYFLGGLFDSPTAKTKTGMTAPNDEVHNKNKNADQKQDINIPLEEGVTSIANLWENKDDLVNQKVVVKGIVTKFNPKIMNKNWVHIQDGTGGEGAFDLTITTQDDAVVGDLVTFEGIVVIDQDFGHGYKYDLLMENGTKIDEKTEVSVN